MGCVQERASEHVERHFGVRRRCGSIVIIGLIVAGVGLQGDCDPSAGPCGAGEGARGKPVRKALIIGIDGLSGDSFHTRAFVDGAAPRLKSLAESGVYTVCESSDDERCAVAHNGPNVDEAFEWRTASGWLSVVTGVDSTKHRVASNDHMAEYDRTRERYPSFFRLLKERGFKTAAGGVSTFVSSPILHPFGVLWIGSKPGIVDYENGMDSGVPARTPSFIDYRYSTQKLFNRQDEKLTKWLSAMIECGDADLIMPVFDVVDALGHDHGYGDNPGYMGAITELDDRIGAILSLIDERVRNRDESWLIVVTSDHGGHTNPYGGGNHTTQPEDQRIPFIVSAIPPLPLAPLQYPVTQMDVFPTVLAWFGVEHSPVDGRVQGIRLSSLSRRADVAAPVLAGSARILTRSSRSALLPD